MFRLNLERLVKQLTPPHRRTKRRLQIAKILLQGLKLIWENIFQRTNTDIVYVSMIPQKKVLQYHAERIFNIKLEIKDNNTDLQGHIDNRFLLEMPIQFYESWTYEQATEYYKVLYKYIDTRHT